MTKLIVLIGGDSGCGKTTIANFLSKTIDGFDFVKSRTTRLKRKNEDDDAYKFLTLSDFKEDEASGFIFESVLIDGQYYWKRKTDIVTDKEISLMVVDINGFIAIPEKIKEFFPDVTIVKLLLHASKKKIVTRLRLDKENEESIKKRTGRTISSLQDGTKMESLADEILDNNYDIMVTASNFMNIIRKYMKD